MSHVFEDDTPDYIQRGMFPEQRKPLERSVVEIEDRTGWTHTEIIQGPPPHPGSRWDGTGGGKVIDSRSHN